MKIILESLQDYANVVSVINNKNSNCVVDKGYSPARVSRRENQLK